MTKRNKNVISHNKWQQIIIKEDGFIMGNCKLRIENGEIMLKNGALSMWWGMMMGWWVDDKKWKITIGWLW
jgi:hypothetical protein